MLWHQVFCDPCAKVWEHAWKQTKVTEHLCHDQTTAIFLSNDPESVPHLPNAFSPELGTFILQMILPFAFAYPTILLQLSG